MVRGLTHDVVGCLLGLSLWATNTRIAAPNDDRPDYQMVDAIAAL